MEQNKKISFDNLIDYQGPSIFFSGKFFRFNENLFKEKFSCRQLIEIGAVKAVIVTLLKYSISLKTFSYLIKLIKKKFIREIK